jgi:hypothetical protein
VQAKPFQDMHWFDPFGSVAIQDIKTFPKVAWSRKHPMIDPRAKHFLFWDQEPLYPETVNDTLPAFCKLYFGQRHLITSEKDSNAVRDACATYGFQPHYYFFHGWAALDWFRGYDRTFLMTPPQQRKITHTMLMPNRIVGGRRQHRLILYYNFLKKHLNFKNCLISFPAFCPGENLSIEAAVQPLKDIYPDISEVVSVKDLPLHFKNENDHPMQSCWLDLFDEGSSSLLYLITETIAQGQKLHLTEKTFKPICMRMPFVLASTCGSLRYLRNYGFRTFGHIWDESYDDEPNDVLRMERIASLIVSLDELPRSAKQELFFECLETVEHNYRHFYDGTFERILWCELTNMMEDMGV